MLWGFWSVISRCTVSFMYSRLLYAKTRKESRLVSSGQYPCLFHQGASCTTPSCHSNSIARRDKPINVSLSRSGKSCFGARGVCVRGGGGEGAGYVKIVMTGMCGPNFSYKLTYKPHPVRIICFNINSKLMSVNLIHCKLI